MSSLVYDPSPYPSFHYRSVSCSYAFFIFIIIIHFMRKRIRRLGYAMIHIYRMFNVSERAVKGNGNKTK